MKPNLRLIQGGLSIAPADEEPEPSWMPTAKIISDFKRVCEIVGLFFRDDHKPSNADPHER